MVNYKGLVVTVGIALYGLAFYDVVSRSIALANKADTVEMNVRETRVLDQRNNLDLVVASVGALLVGLSLAEGKRKN